MTACFAGPVFNILIGMGIGFSALATKTGEPKTKVALDASVITGFIFVMLNCAAILCVGLFLGNGRIPKQHGYLALGLYVLYVVISIGLQYAH
jgi:sodium/potassium/calcium exchanger 6